MINDKKIKYLANSIISTLKMNNADERLYSTKLILTEMQDLLKLKQNIKEIDFYSLSRLYADDDSVYNDDVLELLDKLSKLNND